MHRNLTLTLSLLLLFLVACAGGADLGKPTILFNITSDLQDPHGATMAMQLAGHALDAGRKVVLFCNVKAVALATDLPAAKVTFKKNKPLAEMRAALQKRGATVLVCPHCMHAMGLEDDQLAPGIAQATKENLLDRLGANTVVFTY